MMDLFYPDGHLTPQAMQGLMDGTLDELGRLEVAEHLGFCNQCMQTYTKLLCQSPLMEPPQDMTLPVMRQVRVRNLRTELKRWGMVAASVAVAGTLWYTGVFQQMGQMVERDYTPSATAQSQEQPEPQRPTLSQMLQKWEYERQKERLQPDNRPYQLEQLQQGPTNEKE